MNRRRFLQNLAVTGAALETAASEPEPQTAEPPSVEGHTLLSEFTLDGVAWKVYEDLRVRDGSITFVPSRGAARVISKTAEPTFSTAAAPHLGLNLQEIGASGPAAIRTKTRCATRRLRSGRRPGRGRLRAAPPRVCRGTPSSAPKSASTP